MSVKLSQKYAKSVRLKFGAARRGLTLMELVVVMGVMAAFAAIVIPMFPNLLRRAHKVTDATQTNEIAKAVQLYQAAFVSYPDNLDLLTDGTTGFPSFIPSDGGDTFGGFVVASTLSLDARKALARVGIQYVQPMAATATTNANYHPTMNPYPTDAPLTDRVDITSAAGTNLQFAMLANNTVINSKNPLFLQAIRAADPTATFVVFGVGNRCTMVGQTIQDAPTSVPQNKSFTPDTLYSRVGLIFMVSGAEVSRTERARLIAAVALEDDELETTEKDLIGYYNVAKGNQ